MKKDIDTQFRVAGGSSQPVGYRAVSAPLEKKLRHIDIVISATAPARAIYANAYSIEVEGDQVLIFFAYQSEQSSISTRVDAISVSIGDILNQAESFESYLQKTAPFVNEDQFTKPIRGIFAVDKVETASVIQVSRMNSNAEIVFASFVLHDVVVWKAGQPKIEARRNLLVRCPLHMQVDLLVKIIEASGKKYPESSHEN